MEQHPASFRDPAGQLYVERDRVVRTVRKVYEPHYSKLVESGLSQTLVDNGLLIPFREVDSSLDVWKTIEPDLLHFVSYPYEWCFSQLQDAALCTLQVQEKAMEFGMTLKDASAYNIQFHKGKPMLIDHLSFELLEEGKPWIAYQQFCEHFLAPLVVMHYRREHILPLLQAWPNGMPLALAVSMLPSKSKLNPGVMMHLHMHNKAQAKQQQPGADVEKEIELKKSALPNLIRNLRETIEKLTWTPNPSHWTGYVDGVQAGDYLKPKQAAVLKAIRELEPESVWDLGANTGLVSLEVALKGPFTVALESDAACVESIYKSSRKSGPANCLPLVCDLAHPTPAIGWANTERQSLSERGPADVALALALVHHLAIANNVPLLHQAKWMAGICNHLLVEWVPRSDERVNWLLRNRQDIFHDYNQEVFEASFSEYFTIDNKSELGVSGRVLYQMTRR